MNLGTTPINTRTFTAVRLPWLVAAGAFLVYCVTLNPWVSFSSLSTVTRVSGRLVLPQVDQPLTCLIFLPFHLLPAPWIPLALNSFTAVCAALVLALLARSVALLPHDLTPDDPLRKKRPAAILATPTAWMPPALAALMCGLQLSFWEHATAASGEMINLLAFAYIIRCLLEFRVDRKASWLCRAALLYGAGMANNWAMIGFLPVFLASLLWLNGLGFLLKPRLWLRLALWGLAGLSFYLLLPLFHSMSTGGDVDFWLALKTHLKAQKDALGLLSKPSFRALALVSMLPLLLLAVRWKSLTTSVGSGDDNRFGVFFTRLTGHFVHALFLIGPIWLSLDPAFSPRVLDYGTPMLPYYFLAALVFGYCAGYFLLLGSIKTFKHLATAARLTVAILVCLLPAALLWRNLAPIRQTNGAAVREFARHLHEDLPKGQSVVLSDDADQLSLLQAEAAHGEKNILALDALSLFSARYQAVMARRFPSRWPVASPTNRFETMTMEKLLNLASAFAGRERVYYLHPSAGLFVEPFLVQPQGSAHQLVPRPANAVDSAGPRLSESVVASNEHLWQQRWTNQLQILAGQVREKPAYASALLQWLRLPARRNSTALTLGAAYSKSLNYWGVEMQRHGRWREAGVWFQRALELNPDNLPACINARFNERWQRGGKTRLNAALLRGQMPERFNQYDTWREALNAGGPVDEPTFLLRTARLLLEGGHPRQAADTFARCAELAPAWLAPKLGLAESCIQLREFEKALRLTESVPVDSYSRNGPALAQLLYCQTMALRRLERTNGATACIERFTRQHGEHADVLMAGANLYAAAGQFEPALALVNALLEREPKNPDLLERKGVAEVRLGRNDDAIATLTAALAVAPTRRNARGHRAIASLGAGQLDAAHRDFQELLRTADSSTETQNALLGLGNTAWRRHDTNAAIQFYRQFLSNSIPDPGQLPIVTERLKQLEGVEVN